MASEKSSDIEIEVDDMTFHLHKVRSQKPEDLSSSLALSVFSLITHKICVVVCGFSSFHSCQRAGNFTG